MLKELFRDQKRLEQKYFLAVQEYIRNNREDIVINLWELSKKSVEITFAEVKVVIGSGYPKAKWLEADDEVQILHMLKTIGCKFGKNAEGKEVFNPKKMYEDIINKHINDNWSNIFECLADLCDEMGGRITYPQLVKAMMLKPFGSTEMDKQDMRVCVLLFLKELELLFNYDDMYVYFP